MIYDETHKRDFEGAKGKCEICGLEIELDDNDSPKKHWLNWWVIPCPHCRADVECSKPPAS